MEGNTMIKDKNLDELTKALLGKDDATTLVQLFRLASESEAYKAVGQLTDIWAKPTHPKE